MRTARLAALALATLTLSAAARAVEVTALPPPSGTGVERGVAVLRCATSTHGVDWESRGAVLDVDTGGRGDVLLTTGHGLPSGTEAVLRRCRVLAGGKWYAVRAVWRGDPNEPAQDWAVLLTKRILGKVERLRPALVEDEGLARLADARTPVRLELRYAGEAQSKCHLEPREATLPPLVPHSCLSHSGLSGTPLVMGVANERVVIGVHLGSQLTWDGSRIDIVSVARALDEQIAVAIRAAELHSLERARR